MDEILVVVDMQNDFVSGALGTPQAQAILPAVVQLAREFEGEVVFTRDTHGDDYLQTQEGRALPVPHCLRGSPGWQLADELEQFRKEKGCRVFDKPTFGSEELAAYLRARRPERVVLCGVCTDICVVSNALLLRALLPEEPLFVAARYCAGTTEKSHFYALETMKSCQILQI